MTPRHLRLGEQWTHVSAAFRGRISVEKCPRIGTKSHSKALHAFVVKNWLNEVFAEDSQVQNRSTRVLL